MHTKTTKEVVADTVRHGLKEEMTSFCMHILPFFPKKETQSQVYISSFTVSTLSF